MFLYVYTKISMPCTHLSMAPWHCLSSHRKGKVSYSMSAMSLCPLEIRTHAGQRPELYSVSRKYWLVTLTEPVVLYLQVLRQENQSSNIFTLWVQNSSSKRRKAILKYIFCPANIKSKHLQQQRHPALTKSTRNTFWRCIGEKKSKMNDFPSFFKY